MSSLGQHVAWPYCQQASLRQHWRLSSALRVVIGVFQTTLAALQLVTRLRMLDKGAAVIDWRLRGQLGVFPIDICFRSTFELDLITGRVRPCKGGLLDSAAVDGPLPASRASRMCRRAAGLACAMLHRSACPSDGQAEVFCRHCMLCVLAPQAWPHGMDAWCADAAAPGRVGPQQMQPAR